MRKQFGIFGVVLAAIAILNLVLQSTFSLQVLTLTLI